MHPRQAAYRKRCSASVLVHGTFVATLSITSLSVMEGRWTLMKDRARSTSSSGPGWNRSKAQVLAKRSDDANVLLSGAGSTSFQLTPCFEQMDCITWNSEALLASTGGLAIVRPCSRVLPSVLRWRIKKSNVMGSGWRSRVG